MVYVDIYLPSRGNYSFYHIYEKKIARSVIQVECESNNHGKTYTLYRNLDNYVLVYIGKLLGSLFFLGGGLRMFSIFYSHIEKKYRPGHGPSLQVTVSVLVPEQNFPPCKGAGFEQVLWRVFMPPPHVFEHELKGAHALQLPSTKKNNL